VEVTFLVGIVMAWLLLFVGHVMLLVAAFREGPGWGLAVLFVGPIAVMIFTFSHWEEAKRGFLVQLAGVVLIGLSFGAGIGAGVESATRWKDELRPGSVESRVTALIETGERSEPKARGRSEVASGEAERVLGWPLNRVKDELGAPLGTMKTGGKTVLCYEGVDIVSTNGETATAVVVRPSE